jgi:hypothetical protein
MARNFGTSVNLASNEIQNVLAQNLAAAPGTPKAGQFYYDTVKKALGIYNGSGWVYPTEGGGTSEAEAAKLGTVMVKNDLGGSGTSPTVVHFTLTSDSSAGTHRITALAEPTNSEDAATKGYVDGKINGLNWKQAVKVASAADLAAYTAAGVGAAHTLTANANGILEVDGVKVETLGQRVLLKNAAEAKNNGIYTMTTKGEAGAKWILTRSADGSTEAQLLEATAMAEEGTENGDKVFNQTTNPGFVVDTTALTWVEIQSGTAVQGDGTYTTRTGATIALVPGEAAAAVPANGAISAITKTGARKAILAFTGDGAKTEFEPTHGLKTRNLIVQAMENSGGNPTKPIELDWETSGAEKVIFKFPVAPTAGVAFHVTIIG